MEKRKLQDTISGELASVDTMGLSQDRLRNQFICIIYMYSPRPRHTTWWAAGWTLLVEKALDAYRALRLLKTLCMTSMGGVKHL
jgi:hypothetical protein